jgi:hypothetical protein
MWHNRRHVELARIVVVIPFDLDAVASDDNKHIESNNVQHHILLVVLVEAGVTFLAKQPLIVNMLDDVLVFNAPITIDVELVFNVLFVVINLNDALDFEHTDQQVLEELHLDLMLEDDE